MDNELRYRPYCRQQVLQLKKRMYFNFGNRVENRAEKKVANAKELEECPEK